MTHLFHFGGSAGLAKYRGGNSWRDGTGRYFSRQNSWRDGTGLFFFRGGTGRLFFFSEAGRGGRVFFPKRDGAVVFFFRGGTGRLYFFSEAGRGGCIFFSRRDGTGWLCFFSAGTGRLYFLFAPGRAFLPLLLMVVGLHHYSAVGSSTRPSSSSSSSSSPLYCLRENISFDTLIRRSSRGHNSRKATQPSHCGTCLILLIFIAKRVQPSLPSSTLRSNFVYPRQISRSPRVGHCMS